MENLKINGTTSVQQTSSTSKKEETKATTPEMKKDGNKKLKLALAGLAITGAAITAGVMIYKGHGKKAAETMENAAETVKKLSGNFDERLVKIRQEYSLDDLRAESQEMVKAFKELKEETISSLDDSFISTLLDKDVYPDNAPMVLKSALEEDFTPDELSKIMKDYNYRGFLRKYITYKAEGADTNYTNTILNHLHEICENS